MQNIRAKILTGCREAAFLDGTNNANQGDHAQGCGIEAAPNWIRVRDSSEPGNLPFTYQKVAQVPHHDAYPLILL
jgi:hypothetical protein